MEVDVLPHGTAVTVLILLPKRRLWRSASEILSGNERQITACRRYIHSPLIMLAGLWLCLEGLEHGGLHGFFSIGPFIALAGALWFVSDWFE